MPLRVKLPVWPAEPLLVKAMAPKVVLAAKSLFVVVCVVPLKVRAPLATGATLPTQLVALPQVLLPEALPLQV